LLEDKDLPEYEILTFLMEDKAYILLNTSGDTLYKR
jgi:23S rRNA G2445 N2-methylase RlmL